MAALLAACAPPVDVWKHMRGPGVEDAKLGQFRAPLDKVYAAILGVLADEGIPVVSRSQMDGYIRSGPHKSSSIYTYLTCVENVYFVENNGISTVTWKTSNVTARQGSDAVREDQETPLGNSDEDMQRLAQSWYYKIHKKLRAR